MLSVRGVRASIGKIASAAILFAVATVSTSFGATEEVPIKDTRQNDTFRDTDLSQQSKTPSPYTRSAFGYRSYTTSTDVGFYTKRTCKTNIDHVVSLKDAHQSGASSWSNEDKSAFANDRTNHVPSCARVNSSKGASTPTDFLRKSRDGKGMDYEIVDFCSYVKIYHRVKNKYRLSFSNNRPATFARCGLTLPR
jgi:hypothetical protein